VISKKAKGKRQKAKEIKKVKSNKQNQAGSFIESRG
jgi:hypothetical protein